ncbi:hypothetical protein DFH11DRAFT_1238358 [Phellopilus nigrolimitatus]|nr:hypothetical protein DFH11DRAFT_1238358 [Phellopilus nigrolimitatus]
MFLQTRFSGRKVLSVIAGVGFATLGDYSTWGLLLTLLGTFLATLKAISMNVLQSRSQARAPPRATGSIEKSNIHRRNPLHPRSFFKFSRPSTNANAHRSRDSGRLVLSSAVIQATHVFFMLAMLEEEPYGERNPCNRLP